MRIMIREEERGLLYREGRLVEWLEPGGTFRFGFGAMLRVERLDLSKGYEPSRPELEAILPEGVADIRQIKVGEVGLLIREGEAIAFLTAGRYLVWKVRGEVELQVFGSERLIVDVAREHRHLFPAGTLREEVVAEHERAVVFRDGVAVRLLAPGAHLLFDRGARVQVNRFNLELGYTQASVGLREVITGSEADFVEVGAEELGVVRKEGRVQASLRAGEYFIWRGRGFSVTKYAMEPLITDVPKDAFGVVPSDLMISVLVQPYERSLVYADGVLAQVLEPGLWGLNVGQRKVSVLRVDLREQELQVVGQEVMSADKVTLRINVLVKYRIVEPALSHERAVDLQRALYAETQMIARRLVGGLSVDELLEARHDAPIKMRAQIDARAKGWGVEVLEVDIKDVILPGDMKSLLNRVIEAEKEAAARVILRREENAATRSQANTAKMMANNPTLMRLKELEVLKEITGQIDQLTVIGGAQDLLKQLRIQADVSK